MLKSPGLPLIKTPDVLRVNLSRVPTPAKISVDLSRHGILTGEQLFTVLQRLSVDHRLWVITYTYNPIFAGLLPPIDRLVYQICTGSRPRRKDYVARIVHTKAVYILNKSKIIDVFVGSQNLVTPTNHNLMVRLPQSSHADMVTYFEQLLNPTNPQQ